MTTTMKTISVKLTDIWMDCQKEMIDLQQEVRSLKSCLKTADQIRKYLEKCNETLVTIIELCQLDTSSSSSSRRCPDRRFQQLIGSVKQLEECIEQEKQSLKTFVDRDRQEFNVKTTDRLNREWNHCKKLKKSIVLTYDKSVQTIKEEEEMVEENSNKQLLLTSPSGWSSVVITVPTVSGDKQFDGNYQTVDNSLTDSKSEVKNDVIIDEEMISCSPIAGTSDNDFDDAADSDDTDVDDDVEDIDLISDSDNDYMVSPSKKRKRRSPKKTGKPKPTEKSLKKKERMNNRVLPLLVDDQYVCDYHGCQYTSSKKSEMYKHLNRHKIEDKQSVNPFDRQHREELARIRNICDEYRVDKLFVCREIGCQFSHKVIRHFYSHLRKHERLKNLVKPMDSIKGFGFKISDRIINQIVEKYQIGDQYVCFREGCQFVATIAERQEFYLHHRSHDKLVEPIATDNPQRPYGCPECSVTWDKLCGFMRHVRDIHSKLPFVCRRDNCGHRLKNFKQLVAHLNVVHENKRNYVCDWPGCEYRGAQVSHLKQHRLHHSDTKGLACEWPGCQYRCKLQWAMVVHRRTHTREKPYACDWPGCTYSAAVHCALKIHKRRHTGEKPYVCGYDGCDKRFSSMPGLNAHRKQHKIPVK
ncbi:zinc finger protein 84-like [Oppia nitens]|uniref:zinc finger protein 84-like n=1 Tax=Oppia nitens TaxID=1686743 RepID=UPI0023DC2E01|nr:zinc finger protein 84-like [Oppia nitens]